MSGANNNLNHLLAYYILLYSKLSQGVRIAIFKMIQEELKFSVDKGKIEWSAHALRRMLERGISREAVKHIICAGEMIENYPDEIPFPCGLFFGKWKNQFLHVVIAYDTVNQVIFLITAYWPDERHFESDFKTRRKNEVN